MVGGSVSSSEEHVRFLLVWDSGGEGSVVLRGPIGGFRSGRGGVGGAEGIVMRWIEWVSDGGKIRSWGVG